MAKHYIIMSSSYADGTRIALDFAGDTVSDIEKVKKAMKEIELECGKDVPLSVHFLETASDSWESVIKEDPFFEDVVCIDYVKEFSRKIKQERELLGLDIALYILTKVKCTHLSIEKLSYLAYADYLCEHSKRLFSDRIFAFTFGPVVESVYDACKKSGSKFLDESTIEDDRSVRGSVEEMPAKSRILFAMDGAEKLYAIDKTIDRYGKYSARELVDFTHRKGSPWSRVDSSKPYQTISDELIEKYHHLELPQ